VQLLQWFRNSADTYIGGVDVNVAKRTTLSYDQFYVYSKGDSSFELAGATYQTSTLTPGIPPVLTPAGGLESLGVDTLATAKCGTANATASKNTSTLQVVNAWPTRIAAGPWCKANRHPHARPFPPSSCALRHAIGTGSP